MLYFIPAWYQQGRWRENEQYWHVRRMKTEFDDTVKHIQLFHRSQAYPFRIMLLSYAPNFRHFLHRQSVFHAPYWSVFDAIQEIRRKKISMFSFHNLNWPEHIEFIYTPFVMMAFLHGEKYAQVEFGEDGNTIQVDMYRKEKIQRRNIYDDRGFVSGTIIFEEEKPLYQDYLTDKGVWKLREFFADGHVEVNPKNPTYLIEYDGQEYSKKFKKDSYEGMVQVIFEVLTEYLKFTDKQDLFCAAMHDLHTELLQLALKNRKKILSFYGERYGIRQEMKNQMMVREADYIITDTYENLEKIQGILGDTYNRITDITPFDSRVDFGISQQLSVQKIMVPVDGLEDKEFKEMIQALGTYLPMNGNARVHLFTRLADYNRKNELLQKTRQYLAEGGYPEAWASEEAAPVVAENNLDAGEVIPVKFFVEQCVDELAVSKCIREQRIIVDMRKNRDLYLRITGISVGIPQIVYRENAFVEDGKNGAVLKDAKKLPKVLHHYLDNLTNWNEAMVYSYEVGKQYTTGVLIEKWKEVIDFVEHN